MTPEELGRWILAIGKHLKAFAVDARLAALFATRQASMEGELLLRVRGLRVVSRERLQALAMEAGLAPQQLTEAVKRIERTKLIDAAFDPITGSLLGIRESILTEAEIYRAVSELFEQSSPWSAERVMAPLLELLSKLPVSQFDAIEYLTKLGHSEEDVEQALEIQSAFGLMRKKSTTDFREPILYNDYLWGHKIEKVGPLLSKLGRSESESLLALIEEVRAAQGLSLDHITSVPRNVIALAAHTGIIDTTTIETSTGDRKIFAFTPHFYGYRAGKQPSRLDDQADQVKLFVASIGYGVNHSKDFRLRSPIDFVSKLLRTGEAGDATPILRDYGLLEKYGIVAVEERSIGRGTFVLKKSDVIERALDVLTGGSLLDDGHSGKDARSLVSQSGFKTPELNRLQAGFAEQAGTTATFESDMIAAIREEALKERW